MDDDDFDDFLNGNWDRTTPAARGSTTTTTTTAPDAPTVVERIDEATAAPLTLAPPPSHPASNLPHPSAAEAVIEIDNSLLHSDVDGPSGYSSSGGRMERGRGRDRGGEGGTRRKSEDAAAADPTPNVATTSASARRTASAQHGAARSELVGGASSARPIADTVTGTSVGDDDDERSSEYDDDVDVVGDRATLRRRAHRRGFGFSARLRALAGRLSAAAGVKEGPLLPALARSEGFEGGSEGPLRVRDQHGTVFVLQGGDFLRPDQLMPPTAALAGPTTECTEEAAESAEASTAQGVRGGDGAEGGPHAHHLSTQKVTTPAASRASAAAVATHHCWLRHVPLLEPLAATFGLFPILGLASVYFIIKGIGAHMIVSGALPLFKDVYNVSGTQFQAFATLMIVGWALKPAMGLLSDFVVLGGYHKRSWMLVAVVLGTCAAFLFAALPGPSSSSPSSTSSATATSSSHNDNSEEGYYHKVALFGAFLGFLVSIAQATMDLLIEGSYCQLMQLAPHRSSALISWAWGNAMTGGVVSASLEGPIADLWSPRVCIVIVAVTMALSGVAVVRNWSGEARFVAAASQGRNRRRGGGSDRRSSSSGGDGSGVAMVPRALRDASRDVIIVQVDPGAAPLAPLTVTKVHGDDEEGREQADKNASPALSPDRNPAGNVTTKLHLQEGSPPTPPITTLTLTPKPTRPMEQCRSLCGGAVLVMHEKASQHRPVVLFGALLAVTATAMAAATIAFSSTLSGDETADGTTADGAASQRRRITAAWLQLAVSASATALLSVACFRCLPPIIAKANVFMLFKEMLYVQIGGPLDYFFVAGPECIRDGPHFSYTYYQTFTSVVGYSAGAVGVALFHRYFASRSFHRTVQFTTTVKILASFFDIMIVKRWNRHAFGGSGAGNGLLALLQDDHLVYFLGDAIVYQAVSMLDQMPMVLLTSRLCPKGIECTMYAILAGLSNFGVVLSNTIGSLLLALVFPVRTTPPSSSSSSSSSLPLATADPDAPVRDTSLDPGYCDFSNLPSLLLVGHMLLPLLTFVLIPLMLPDVPMDQPIRVPEHDNTSSSSSAPESSAPSGLEEPARDREVEV